ncbi:hypothetical protein GGR50DRAFT_240772 [Xylaria sp. CBS 124048]|nr:hypothetical protein GGR50DRAFT_240772 [Xylaria sp. CBS 124048]
MAPPEKATVRAHPALEVGYLMEALRQCRSSGARKIIGTSRVSYTTAHLHPALLTYIGRIILRTMNIKVTRTAGSAATTDLSSSRNQTLEAITAQLVLHQVHVEACDGCVSGDKGQSAECISFGKEYFGGACSCCHYTSQAAKCSFHISQKGSRYATMRMSKRSITRPHLHIPMIILIAEQ